MANYFNTNPHSLTALNKQERVKDYSLKSNESESDLELLNIEYFIQKRAEKNIFNPA